MNDHETKDVDVETQEQPADVNHASVSNAKLNDETTNNNSNGKSINLKVVAVAVILILAIVLGGYFGAQKARENNDDISSVEATSNENTVETSSSYANNNFTSTAFEKENFDFDVDPSENFYLFANGGWMRNNPIPPEYSYWGPWNMLRLQTKEQIKVILEQLSNGTLDGPTSVARYYFTALDEAAVNAAGIDPLRPILEIIDHIVSNYTAGDGETYARLLGEIDGIWGLTPFFQLDAGMDDLMPNHSVPYIIQAGLGLPDREYYFSDDESGQEIIAKYIEHVAKMFALLETNQTDPSQFLLDAALQVYNVEKEIAEAHIKREDYYDPYLIYNMLSVEQISNFSESNFSYADYLVAATNRTVDELGNILVLTTEALYRGGQVFTTMDPATLEYFLKWKMLHTYSRHLPTPFLEQDFSFYSTTLRGVTEMKQRWELAVDYTERALGEALGKVYVEKHFDEDSKDRVLGMVNNLLTAMKETLEEEEWIESESTRSEALDKLANMKPKIGYPDTWTDFSSLQFDESDTLVSMEIKARLFQFKRTIAEMNAPTDPEKWFMTPQTVNAYYDPLMNEIVFPAAFLQFPFFDKESDDAVNYGGVGAIIGHEITHGFDNSGRHYDADGLLRDWWSKADSQEYEKRLEVIINQANNVLVYDKPLNGNLTVGENVADFGGLRLALRALTSLENFNSEEKIDGFTSIQRFFLAWAQIWRENITKELTLELLVYSYHAPNEVRTNLPLSNMPEFHEAFDIPEDSPMFVALEDRVEIW